jgi:hypothetical protein
LIVAGNERRRAPSIYRGYTATGGGRGNSRRITPNTVLGLSPYPWDCVALQFRCSIRLRAPSSQRSTWASGGRGVTLGSAAPHAARIARRGMNSARTSIAVSPTRGRREMPGLRRRPRVRPGERAGRLVRLRFRRSVQVQGHALPEKENQDLRLLRPLQRRFVCRVDRVWREAGGMMRPFLVSNTVCLEWFKETAIEGDAGHTSNSSRSAKTIDGLVDALFPIAPRWSPQNRP